MVAAMRPFLTALARRTGQIGTLDLIELLVKAPSAMRKQPCLVLVGLQPGIKPERATAEQVEGAVLVYEYLIGGAPSGIFATDDVTGERTVLAPVCNRSRVAAAAARKLMLGGARAALVSVECTETECSCNCDAGAALASVPGWNDFLAVRVREKERDLLLLGSLEETLARMGKKTRRNFRHCRLQAERDLDAGFVPWIQLTPEEFLEIHRSSTHPVSENEAAWRYHMLASLPGRVCCGVRDRDGRWLSIVGGYREQDRLHIEWQVNRAGLPKYSLCTVMRSFLIEHEISVGTHTLQFKGGTPHPMGLSLRPARTLDLIAVRRGLRGRMLRQMARWIFPRSNFLGHALQDPRLEWLT